MTSTSSSPIESDSPSRGALMALNLSMYFRLIFDSIWAANSVAFAAFAFSLHIRPQDIGLATTAISAACLMQLVSLPIQGRIRSRKWFVIGFGLIEPTVVVVAVTSLLWLPLGWRLPVLLFALTSAAGMMHLTKPVTDDWLSQILPARIRARYLGRRVQIIAILSVVMSLGIGQILNLIGKENQQGLCLFIVVGALFGVVSVLLYSRVAEKERSTQAQFRFADLKGALTDRKFVLFLLSIVAYNLPFFLSSAYYQVYFQKTLNMSPGQVGFGLAGYSGVKIVAMHYWRKVLDRMTMQRVFTVIGPVYVIFFGAFAFSEPWRIWPIYMAWAIAGIGDGAYGTIIQATCFRIIPDNNARPAYFAIYNLMMLGTFGVGAMLVWPYLTILGLYEIPLAKFHISIYHVLYAMMSILMFSTIFVSKWIMDAADKPESGAQEIQSAGKLQSEPG